MKQYNATAGGYDELYGEEQNSKYDSALKNMQIGGGIVLDVGCGSGLLFEKLAIRAKIVVGIDISRKLLLKANERQRAFKDVFVLQADADHLPFVDNFFDIVFSFTVLQNMPEPSESLKEWKRVTKRTGRVTVALLKKATSLDSLMYLLKGTGFHFVSFLDEEQLKCYVAMLALDSI